MRPIYERPKDRENERAIAEIVARTESLRVRPTAILTGYDYEFLHPHRDIVVGYAEIKCRTNPASKYPTYMLSLAKYQGLVDLADRTWKRVRLIVGWTDCIGALEIPTQFNVGHGGRSDRGDPMDHEPMAYFPVRNFSLIARAKKEAGISPGLSSF